MNLKDVNKGTKIIVLITLLGFILRLLAAFHFQSESISLEYLGYDEAVYYSFARQMTKTSPFLYTLRDSPVFQDYMMWYLEKPLFHHPPLFVWLLYGWQSLFGDSIFASRLPNVILGSLTIFITY